MKDVKFLAVSGNAFHNPLFASTLCLLPVKKDQPSLKEKHSFSPLKKHADK